MEKDERDVGLPGIGSRLNHFIGAALTACVFIAGLYMLQSGKRRQLDLSQEFYPALSLEEKTSSSTYDWQASKIVRIDLTGRSSGMVTLRALNREILFRTFIENGIPEEVQIEVPNDLEMILVEYQGNCEQISLSTNRLALNL